MGKDGLKVGGQNCKICLFFNLFREITMQTPWPMKTRLKDGISSRLITFEKKRSVF